MVFYVNLITFINYSYLSAGMLTLNSLAISPVSGFSSLSNNYLIILKLEGTTPDASPLWTPSFNTVTSRLAVITPLNDVVTQRCS